MSARVDGQSGQALKRLLNARHGSQLVEFAVALPLLAVLVVGIFDFGAALNLKHELGNAVREGARFGSTLPMSDVDTSIPASVLAVRDLVDAYLVGSGVNDCGLGAPSQVGSSLTWAATGTSAPCSSTQGVQLTINRAYVINPSGVDVISTQVSIEYPYQWRFNSVIQLLVPGANYGGVMTVTADAAMPNMQ